MTADLIESASARLAFPPDVLAAIVPEHRSIRGADGRFDATMVVSYRINGRPARSSLVRAIAVVERSMMPGGAACIRELGRLRKVSRKRESADDVEAARIYADEVERFPVDVVRQACDELMRSSTWWPSIPELLQAFGKIMIPRRLLLRALQQALDEADNPPPAPPTVDEERAALRDKIERDRTSGDLKRAAIWERCLAHLENREVEQWAKRPQPIRPAPRQRPPIDPVLAEIIRKRHEQLREEMRR